MNHAQRNPGSLRNYSAGTIRELRFISPSDATTRFGSGFQGGAIEVFLE
ncbi:MAG: hypothetical protein HKO65_19695 [Gemmatimonadetes bacterium]|nr:hypothetical protein [Gemmatimonadota bacterium]NNM07327.1 hypothetical protein [Gemmatimonadota bacterium]